MSLGGNDNPNIIVEIIAQTEKFMGGISDAIQKATKQFNDFVSKIGQKKITLGDPKATSDLAKAYDAVTKALQRAIVQQRQYAAENNVAKTTANNLAVTNLQMVATYGIINRIIKDTGMSYREAAIEAAKSGQISIDIAQKVMAVEQGVEGATEKRFLTNKEMLGVIDALKKKQEDLNVALNGSKKTTDDLTNATKKYGDETKTTTGFLTRFAERLALYFSIRQVITFFVDATKASLDFAQAQFKLEAFVKAAQIKMGASAGTVGQWKDRVKELRREFSIFSEKELTDAVAQTANLTRAIGLNADQQRQLIEIASTLAQVTGTSLTDAIDDVVKALGGSSVVLDKYGLFVRDADKDTIAMSMGLGQNAKSLNSQQLALVSLNTILRQTTDLTAGLSGYEETLPGQIKEVDATIADQTKNLGEGMGAVGLFVKNIWSTVLDLFNDIADSPVFKQAIDALSKLNDYYKSKRAAQGALGRQELPDDLNRMLKDPVAGFGVAHDRAKAAGIPAVDYIFKREDFLFDEHNKNLNDKINKYLELQQKYINAAKGFFSQNANTGNKIMPWAYGEKDYIPGGPVDTDRLGRIAEETDKYGKAVVSAYNDMVQKLADLETKRNEDRAKADAEWLAGIEKAGLDANRKFNDLGTEAGRKREDIDLNYQRDLEKINEDSYSKQLDITSDYNKKIIDLKDDYYKKLRDLDNQYYFDLRDAVADNDAVAVKRLERKYNLDKQKLQDQLGDKTIDESKSYQLSLAKLADDTADRKKELDRRYNQELEDLRTYIKRKYQEIDKDYQRELADLSAAHTNKLAEIEANYIAEGQLINAYYQQQLDDLARKIDAELKLTDSELQQIFGKYAAMYGPGGSLLRLMQQYQNQQLQLAGSGYTIDQPYTGYTNPIGGTFSRQYTDTSGRIHYVVIQNDGTTSDYIIGQVADQLANAIGTIVTAGGYTYTPTSPVAH